MAFGAVRVHVEKMQPLISRHGERKGRQKRKGRGKEDELRSDRRRALGGRRTRNDVPEVFAGTAAGAAGFDGGVGAGVGDFAGTDEAVGVLLHPVKERSSEAIFCGKIYVRVVCVSVLYVWVQGKWKIEQNVTGWF